MVEVTDIGEDSISWLVMETSDEGVARNALAKHIIDIHGFNEDTMDILQAILEDAETTFRRDWAWESRVPSFNYAEAGVDLDEAWLRHGEEVPEDYRFPRFEGFLYSL